MLEKADLISCTEDEANKKGIICLASDSIKFTVLLDVLNYSAAGSKLYRPQEFSWVGKETLNLCTGSSSWLILCGASWLSGSMRDVQARDRGFDPRLHWICSDVVLLGKALCPHVHSHDPGVSGCLVGQWRLVCLNSSVRQNGSRGVCSPGSWDGLWTNRSCDQGVIV